MNSWKSISTRPKPTSPASWQRVAMGEEVIIAKAGTPVAKLVPVKARPKKRVLGSAKGEFTVPDDFNDPLPKEIEDLFYE